MFLHCQSTALRSVAIIVIYISLLFFPSSWKEKSEAILFKNKQSNSVTLKALFFPSLIFLNVLEVFYLYFVIPHRERLNKNKLQVLFSNYCLINLSNHLGFSSIKAARDETSISSSFNLNFQ